MTTKRKAFDCVEMKRLAQERIMAQCEARKQEFSSYGEFLEATPKESDWGRRTLKRICRRQERTAD